jgi:hypothetical protein
MPRKYKKLGPVTLIKQKLKLKEKWKTNRDYMLKRSKSGNKQSVRSAIDRREKLINQFKSFPVQMSKAEMRERILGFLLPHDYRKPDSFIAKLIKHGLLKYDDQTGYWTNHCNPNTSMRCNVNKNVDDANKWPIN